MKEAIFHSEARAEVRESVEFYETRLDGLGKLRVRPFIVYNLAVETRSLVDDLRFS